MPKALFKDDFEDKDKLHLTNTTIYNRHEYDIYSRLRCHKSVKTIDTMTELLSHEKYNEIIYLDINNQNLFELPELPNELYELSCQDNYLYSLPILPYNLRIIHCTNNNLYKLPDCYPPHLIYIDCSRNNIFKIDKLPPKLEILHSEDNNLTFLPKLPKTMSKFTTGDNSWSFKSPILNKIKKIFPNMKIKEYSSDYGEDDDGSTDDMYDSMPQHYDTLIYWCKVYEFYQKRNVKKIEKWYLNCKYDPKYKKCRERLEREYDDMYID